MKVPISWLKDFVEINAEVEESSNLLTLSGSKVESIEKPGEGITNVVVGKIVSIEKHPNADKLLVTKVDIGNDVIQVVTGAQNVSPGDYVPVALHGSTLAGGLKIKKSKLRGVESNGMLCSIQELGLTKNEYPDADEDGIFILGKEQAPGEQKLSGEGKCEGKDKYIDEDRDEDRDKDRDEVSRHGEEAPGGHTRAKLTPGQDVKEALGLDDTIIEFEITPNRPDCLSILGIAREASAVLGCKLAKPEIILKEEGEDASKFAAVEIEAPDLCPRYAARIIKDIKVEPSPEWMQRRLRAAGVRPINNIVDVTNYVMLELGQPLHAFDLEFIKGRKIIVRRANSEESIKTLDGQERKLDPSMLVIADGERPVAVAGVMGGENSEIHENTRIILLESANFNGVSVRLTSKKLGIRTEASGRFEKGLDVENVITAINRAARLIEEIGAGKVCNGIIDCFPGKKEERTIKLRPEKINALLGTSINPEDMVSMLESLEFKVERSNMTVRIPPFRQDVEREADIAEEIARLYDYNKIKPTLLEGKALSIGKKTYKQKIEDLIKYTMMSCGLSEIYTYSFLSPKVFDRMRTPQESNLRKAVIISNPLGEDYSIMRTTTIPAMLNVIGRNCSRDVKDVKLFELSYVYLPKELPLENLPEEKPLLTLGVYGGGADFYDLKGVLEELLTKLRVKDYEFIPEKNNPVFHPGRTAKLAIAGKEAGVIGEIHPDVAEEFEAPERTYIGIIDVMPLVDNAEVSVEYKPLPRFPSVERDIAILVDEKITAADIEKVIKMNGGKMLEEVRLFDVYRGKQIPEGMKSMAYSLTFRAEDRTLTVEEANEIMGKIINSLKDVFNARLRE
jgi:phenylalanyl-tRNA synthetase beta chain